MGQKVHPIGMRLGIIREHRSSWYANKREFAKNLHIDIEVRRRLLKMLSNAPVSKIRTEIMQKSAVISVHTSRPGSVIGNKGENVDKMRALCEGIIGRTTHINIVEVKKADADATLVAKSIAQQLERRVMFRRAMKRSVQNAMRSGALGVKILVSGRLGGAEIARSEGVKEGRIPLHTLRADVDYATAEALTTYGIIGIKVWVFHGEVLRGSDTSTPAREVRS